MQKCCSVELKGRIAEVRDERGMYLIQYVMDEVESRTEFEAIHADEGGSPIVWNGNVGMFMVGGEL